MPGARNAKALTAYYFVLDREFEPDVALFTRRCAPRSYFVYKDEPEQVTVAFSEPEDALLFMNLFDDEIEDEFKVVSDDSTVAHAA
jgi:hypothetical protein